MNANTNAPVPVDLNAAVEARRDELTKLLGKLRDQRDDLNASIAATKAEIDTLPVIRKRRKVAE